MLRRTVLHVSLCMLLAQHITGEPQNIAGLQNEDIVLCPVLDGKLEEITWKLGNNKIAEYDLFKDTTYYGDFKEQTKLNITSGCLKMNNITDRRDGLYKAELQIRSKLQEREFKLKVYRPVSKPTVTCSVTDSNVTLICEGDESLGDHYRWEGHENQVTNEGKYLTFSKEENHNIEYTCIFSNLKSEERSDRVKNCFVPGGRSHIWVPILVFLAVLAGLIVWGYKYYSRSQDEKSSYHPVQMEEGNSETTTENNTRSTFPLHEPSQCDDPVDTTVNSKATENAHTSKKEVVNGTEEIRAPDPGINEQSKMGSAEKGTQDEEQQKKETEDAETSSESRDEKSSFHPVQMEEGNLETTTENNTRSTFPLHEPSQCDDPVYTTVNSKDVTPSPDSPPQTTGMATTPLLAPPCLDLVNSPPTLETATTPPTLETAKTPPPLETANTPLPPGDDKDTSHPGDSKDFSHLGDGKDSSPPGDGKDFSHPGDDKDSSHPGDDKDSSHPGYSKDFSHPGDGKDSSPPGDGKDSSPLEDGKDSSLPKMAKTPPPPRNVKDASPPGDIKDFSPPAEGKGSSPPAEGKGSSPTGDVKGLSPPGDGKDSSPPAEGKGSSPSGADKASRT